MDKKKTMTAVILSLAALILFGVVVISIVNRADDADTSQAESTASEVTETSTSVIAETVTTASSTETTTTTVQTEPETQPVTEPLPLSEVKINDPKAGNIGGFVYSGFDDNSISIKGLMVGGDDVDWGDATEITVPEEIEGRFVRVIDMVRLVNGAPDLAWPGINSLKLPENIVFANHFSEDGTVIEMSREEAESYFVQYGISVSYY